jgi:hypothetical protein
MNGRIIHYVAAIFKYKRLIIQSVDFNDYWAFMLRRLNVIRKIHRRFAKRQQPGIPDSAG